MLSSQPISVGNLATTHNIILKMLQYVYRRGLLNTANPCAKIIIDKFLDSVINTEQQQTCIIIIRGVIMKAMFEVKQSDSETIEYLHKNFQITEEYPINGFDGVTALAIVVAIIGIVPLDKIIDLAMRPTVTVRLQYPDGRFIEISGTSVKKIKKQIAAIEEAFAKTTKDEQK